ncbi:MAG TPA: hypothetical protein VM936_03485, partial [Pyrinomonadaceae bacterium]|nr:hypothetical protein [Pyrinomonadaceae bacterium]
DFEGFADEGWKLTATTPLGEVGVRGLLMAGVSADDSKRAAAGWGGDRAFLFEREGRAPLFVWRSAWDKTTDAQEFFRAYNTLLQQRATAEGAGSDSDRAWRDGALVTRVRVEGDTVTVVRGAETEVNATSKLTFGR